MTNAFKESALLVLVLGLSARAGWGYYTDKHAYLVAQRFIQLNNCKNPHYEGRKVKYIKQFYEQHTMELGFDNGETLTLTDDQVMNILCE